MAHMSESNHPFKVTVVQPRCILFSCSWTVWEWSHLHGDVSPVDLSPTRLFKKLSPTPNNARRICQYAVIPQQEAFLISKINISQMQIFSCNSVTAN